MKKIFLIICAMVCLNYSCRENFEPNLPSLQQSFLVVEGVINSGDGLTQIRLTRTFKLDDTATVKTENFAQVLVEGKDNSSYTLFSAGNGYYQYMSLNLPAGNEYRLRIKTNSGEYVSDYETAKNTPDIDSIGWKRNAEGIQLYVNTYDPANNTRYYRWEAEETWEIRSRYLSNQIYENGIVRDRIFPQENVSTCWNNNVLKNILLANSTKLQADIINEAPLTLVPIGDRRFATRYSIFVKQFAMSKTGYDFYELMKKNSEQIGSLFAPQPSEIKGNIHSVSNKDEFVLGYVSVSSVKEKRIFISTVDVLPWPGYIYCPEVLVPNIPDSIELYFGSNGLMPVYFTDPLNTTYLGSTPECVDCTTTGGNTNRPAFW